MPLDLISDDWQGGRLVGGDQELGGYTRMVRLKFRLLEGDQAEVQVEITMGYRESEAPEFQGEHLFVCRLLPLADVGGRG